MTPGRPWNRSLERIRIICDSSPDHRSLRGSVLSELGRVVPFNAFVWPLSDPATATGVSPMARVPCPEELQLLIRLKYLTPGGRWTQLAASSAPVTTLLRETGGNPSLSLLWNGLMKRYGVFDVLFAVLADKHGCWGWLDLWRTEQGGPVTGEPFTVEEVGYLAAVVHEVTPALRQSIARQFLTDGSRESEADRAESGESEPLRSGIVRSGGVHADRITSAAVHASASAIGGGTRPELPQQAVLTLDADMAVVGGTSSVEEWLGLLQAGPRPFQGVPAEVLNVAAQLLALEADVDQHPASSRVYLGSGQWAMLRASRMDSAGSVAIPPLAVTIQACPPEARLDMFARSFGLTPRQRELIELAAAGADTAAMAGALGIAAYTVQDQFKQIFDTCGVHSRATLLALAMGTTQ
ncbi:MAG TPA: LuxR family transcriptional regulator [Arthrobacter bacterium]|jgi:DNA-binding CsgD family transcriptional regulator|nr:LuxR family transcriptional regulator [Arthrobacter sp.]HBH59376.1 LuxR family transcriptional regulator [Arthrobacter sp.]HCB58664.1 LuxR family transcriptional regulator [Arthrobacter sp.]HCC39925.1 LuxR family transcriptional regulator [Arthrobacter sp.]HCN22373.1 LuxR family transcriptional regulator [Arthrobacter sp.]